MCSVPSPFLSSSDLLGLRMKNVGTPACICSSPSVPPSELPLVPHGAISEKFQENTLSSRCCRKLQYEALGHHLPNDEKETPLVTIDISKGTVISNKACNVDYQQAMQPSEKVS